VEGLALMVVAEVTVKVPVTIWSAAPAAWNVNVQGKVPGVSPAVLTAMVTIKGAIPLFEFDVTLDHTHGGVVQGLLLAHPEETKTS